MSGFGRSAMFQVLATLWCMQCLQAAVAKVGTQARVDRSIGICQLIENRNGARPTAVNIFEPIRGARVYFSWIEHKELGVEGKVNLLKGPAHGRLEDIQHGIYRYVPDEGYFGTDTATFIVEVGGFKVMTMLFFNIRAGVGGGTEGDDPYNDKKLCPKGQVWKMPASEKKRA